MILEVKAVDPDLRRKGYILAVALVVIAVSTVALTLFNFVNSQPQYSVENFSFLAVPRKLPNLAGDGSFNFLSQEYGGIYN